MTLGNRYISVALLAACACIAKTSAQTPPANSNKTTCSAAAKSALNLKIDNLILLGHSFAHGGSDAIIIDEGPQAGVG